MTNNKLTLIYNNKTYKPDKRSINLKKFLEKFHPENIASKNTSVSHYSDICLTKNLAQLGILSLRPKN